MQAAAAAEVARHWGLVADPSIVVLMNGPMYHSAPAAYGMSSARLGLHVVLQPRFDAEDMLRLITEKKDAVLIVDPRRWTPKIATALTEAVSAHPGL